MASLPSQVRMPFVVLRNLTAPLRQLQAHQNPHHSWYQALRAMTTLQRWSHPLLSQEEGAPLCLLSALPRQPTLEPPSPWARQNVGPACWPEPLGPRAQCQQEPHPQLPPRGQSHPHSCAWSRHCPSWA